MLILLEEIDPPLTPVRRTVDAAADAKLAGSIAACGVLTPILATRDGNRFRVIDGARRVACARAAGLPTIEAEITGPLSAEAEQTAAAAANIVRAPIAPVDQWRAIVALQAAGGTLAHAAASLGITDHQARRLDHLGRLHPDMLALIETAGMPDSRLLLIIAMASHKTQKSAIKAARATPDNSDWHAIARACNTQRIPRSRAIFDLDTGKILWDEALLAEPGSDEQWTTRDVAGFMATQRAALAEQVAASKGRLQLGDIDAERYNGFRLPSGWREEWGNLEKPKRNQVIFVGFAEGGDRAGEIQRILASNPKADAAREKASAKTKTAAGDDTSDDDDAPAETAPPPPTEPPIGITKAGLQIIADAKTEALRTALHNNGAPHNTDMLLLIAILALHGENVSIQGYSRKFSDEAEKHLPRLVSPEGILDLDEQALTEAAAAVLSAILGIGGPAQERSYNHRSGPVAEWIGRAICADRHLPRFDTPEFLATCGAAVLRQAAESAGLKPAKTAAALRAQLAGNAPDWRPDPSQFGAAGPEPIEGKDDEDHAEDAE